MKLKMIKYWNWNKKVLLSWFSDKIIFSWFENLLNKLWITIYFFDDYNFITLFDKNFFWVISYKELNKYYKKDGIQSFYKEIIKYIKDNKITYFHWQTNLYHHSFLNELKKIWVVTITRVTDDPEASNEYSKHLIKYRDKAICSWVYYDKNITIKKKWKQWWAKDVKFIPTFPDITHYDYNKIDYNKKDIDIIHIWAINWKKIKRISKLKKHFWDRLKLFGHYWNWDWKSIKWIIYKVLNWWYWIWYIKKVTDKELLTLYKRSKIWINIHLSYWPSNVRSYEIPLNWWLLIADNPEWYKTLYNVWKEIICYENKYIDDAIEKIEYYLKNEEERIKIAKTWYEKAMKEYTFEKIFEKTLNFMIK